MVMVIAGVAQPTTLSSPSEKKYEVMSNHAYKRSKKTQITFMVKNIDLIINSKFIGSQQMKEICPRGNNKVVIYISLYHEMFIIHARIVLTGNLLHV